MDAVPGGASKRGGRVRWPVRTPPLGHHRRGAAAVEYHFGGAHQDGREAPEGGRCATCGSGGAA